MEVIPLDDNDTDPNNPSSPKGFKCLVSSQDIENQLIKTREENESHESCFIQRKTSQMYFSNNQDRYPSFLGVM